MSEYGPPQGSSFQSPAAPGPQTPAPQGAWSGTSVPATGSLASWGQRVAAYLIDCLVGTLATVPGWIFSIVASSKASTDGGGGGLDLVVLLLFVAAGLFGLWNVAIRQGSTGQSIGKGVMKIKLVELETGEAPGVGVTLARYILRAVLSPITCGVYGIATALWPLWDQQRQTLDDKIVKTLVVQAS